MEKAENDGKSQQRTESILDHKIRWISPLAELCDIDECYNPIRDYIEALNEIAWCAEATTTRQKTAKIRLSNLRDTLMELEKELCKILNQRKKERAEAEQQTEK